MRLLIFNADAQAFQGLEATFEEPDGVFRANTNHGNVVIEFLVPRLKAVRLLVRRDDPFFELESIKNTTYYSLQR
jgi:hypothetical protein